MKQLRFRTVILALVVTGGSSVIGIGLGRVMTKAIMASPKSGMTAQESATTGRGDQSLQLVGADDEGFPALQEIHPNPADLPKNQPVISNDAYNALVSTPNPVPLWNYSYTASAARGGGTYQGTIVGRSPYARGKTTTTLNVQIVPLIITITDGSGTVTYDPTVTDTVCGPLPRNLPSTSIITGSPIFQNNPWVFNGVSMGNTQYLDAFQRGQFWSLVGNTNYHLVSNVTVLPPQSLTFSGGTGANYNGPSFGGCGKFGVVNINNLDPAVQNLIAGPLAGTVNVGTIPIFLTKSVFESVGAPTIGNCCILGYHGAFNVGSNIQTYSPFSLDISGVIGGDVATLSHEIGELLNDPIGNNPTPAWGGIGQQGGCQGNFEVGDPLTGTNPFVVTEPNGYTYHMQELAYISWFYGGPSLAVTPGVYSNNSTFTGAAKNCPPGGTN